MATMRDVAQRAGVSAKTVSRVINNDRYVSADVRERVERAIDELRPEPRHRLRQIGGGDRQANAGDLERGARVDGDDPGAGAVEADELDVERVVEPDVGDIRLPSGHPVETADEIAGFRKAGVLG